MAVNQSKDSLQQSKEDHNELIKIKKISYELNPKTEDLWATLSNSGALSGITFSLPTAVIGDGYKFNIDTAKAVGLKPKDTNTIENPATGAQCAGGVTIYSSVAGSRIVIECKTTGEWEINTKTGMWGISMFYHALSLIKMGH